MYCPASKQPRLLHRLLLKPSKTAATIRPDHTRAEVETDKIEDLLKESAAGRGGVRPEGVAIAEVLTVVVGCALSSFD